MQSTCMNFPEFQMQLAEDHARESGTRKSCFRIFQGRLCNLCFYILPWSQGWMGSMHDPLLILGNMGKTVFQALHMVFSRELQQDFDRMTSTRCWHEKCKTRRVVFKCVILCFSHHITVGYIFISLFSYLYQSQSYSAKHVFYYL